MFSFKDFRWSYFFLLSINYSCGLNIKHIYGVLLFLAISHFIFQFILLISQFILIFFPYFIGISHRFLKYSINTFHLNLVTISHHIKTLVVFLLKIFDFFPVNNSLLQNVCLKLGRSLLFVFYLIIIHAFKFIDSS